MSDELLRYKREVKKNLDLLSPIFSNASIGDFSRDLEIPKKEDEFTQIFVGVQVMLDVIREKLSELGEVNQKLKKRIEEKIKEDRAKTEFLMIASHQTRSPLSAINWYSELLLSVGQGSLSEEQIEYLEKIRALTSRTLKTINYLLDFSKTELGTYEIIKQSVDLKGLVEKVVSGFDYLIKEKSLNVKANYPRVPPQILTDKRILEVIIDNILSNSVKYTSEKGRIEVSIVPKKNSVLMEFEDNGQGITTSDESIIFEKMKSDKEEKVGRSLQGSGWGLYIVNMMTRKLGGKVWYKSKVGKGTKFYIELPKKIK